MPANTSPIFALTPNVNSATLVAATTANVKSDGTGTIGTDLLKAFTAGTAGSLVYSVRFSPCATTAATVTTATTLRIFVSSLTSGDTSSANTFLLQEISAAAQTADHSTLATFFIEVPINKFINASYTILVSTHIVIAAATMWQATVFGGDF